MPGIDADVTVGPLELMASIGVELGRINDRADRAALAEHRYREMMRARVPIDVKIVCSGSPAVDGQDFGLVIGGPAAGFYWLVRRLVMGAVKVDDMAAGTGDIFVSAIGGDQGSTLQGASLENMLTTSELVDLAATLPFVHFYSNRQVIVQAGENLIPVVGGAAAATTYVASAQIEVHRTVSDVDIAFGS